MSRPDLNALAPIRRHREAQAEQVWRQQRDLLRECEAAVAAARLQWQATCEGQTQQRKALCDDHRDRAVSVSELNAWRVQERRLMGELAEQTRALQALADETARQAQSTEAAQQRLRGRRRDLEKLKALTERLAEEPCDE